MKQAVFKRVGLIYGAVGLIVFIMNVVKHAVIESKPFMELFWINYVYLGFGVLFILLSLARKELVQIRMRRYSFNISIERVSTMLQFAVMALIAAYSILLKHDDQYSLSMIMIAGLMGLKYRILGKRSFIVYIVLFAALFEFSAERVGVPIRGLYIILFSAFFFGIGIILYQDELTKQFALTRKFHEKLVFLQKRVDRMEGETIDISSINFTNREVEILKELCVNRGSNQDIAAAFGIKEHTVKTHMSNIFDKAGVDDRHQLIDLFKNNFITVDGEQ